MELAERAGISAPPCLRRVRALEEGYIQGYHAELNPEKLFHRDNICVCCFQRRKRSCCL